VELQKVILFYAFAPVADPNSVRLWQREICERYGLRGRIIISRHGINGTLGGPMAALKRYVRTTKQFPGFDRADFKWSSAQGNEFPRLSVKVRRELVAFTMPDEITVDEQGIVGGGKHLKPEEVNALVAERGEEVVFLDGRNAFEAKIGRFKDSIVPDVQTTHDFIAEIESGKYDHLKSRPIVTYCTGGVRCEVLSVLLRNRGFEEVYQIEGGVVRYGEKYKNDGLWQGSLYVFDGRMKQDFAANPEVIGRCDRCDAATSDFYNCSDPACRDLVLLCSNCAKIGTSFACDPAHTRGRKTLGVG
jgi:UPF0176 protein